MDYWVVAVLLLRIQGSVPLFSLGHLIFCLLCHISIRTAFSCRVLRFLCCSEMPSASSLIHLYSWCKFTNFCRAALLFRVDSFSPLKKDLQKPRRRLWYWLSTDFHEPAWPGCAPTLPQAWPCYLRLHFLTLHMEALHGQSYRILTDGESHDSPVADWNRTSKFFTLFANSKTLKNY